MAKNNDENRDTLENDLNSDWANRSSKKDKSALKRLLDLLADFTRQTTTQTEILRSMDQRQEREERSIADLQQKVEYLLREHIKDQEADLEDFFKATESTINNMWKVIRATKESCEARMPKGPLFLRVFEQAASIFQRYRFGASVVTIWLLVGVALMVKLGVDLPAILKMVLSPGE